MLMANDVKGTLGRICGAATSPAFSTRHDHSPGQTAIAYRAPAHFESGTVAAHCPGTARFWRIVLWYSRETKGSFHRQGAHSDLVFP